jgi:hypothetical protein
MRARTRWPRIALVVIAAAALATISLAANPQLALVSAVSAAAVSLTRVRYATVVAATLLLAVACLSVVPSRKEAVRAASHRITAGSGARRHNRPRTSAKPPGGE